MADGYRLMAGRWAFAHMADDWWLVDGQWSMAWPVAHQPFNHFSISHQPSAISH
jgi:hypothetical protein